MHNDTVCRKNDYDYQQLDNLINSRIRFAAMAYLLSVSEASFIEIRDRIHTTDGNLITHLRKLEKTGYVDCLKRVIDRKPLTLYSATRKGRFAIFQNYLCLQKFCPIHTGFETVCP